MTIDGGLHAEFKRHLPKVHWQRIENSVGNGVPDVNYCIDACEGWLEFKLARGERVRIRPEQIGWMERRSRAGGRVLLVVRRRTGDDSLYMCGPGAGSLLGAGWGLSSLPSPLIRLVAPGGPGNWPWDRVLGLLKAQ